MKRMFGVMVLSVVLLTGCAALWGGAQAAGEAGQASADAGESGGEQTAAAVGALVPFLPPDWAPIAGLVAYIAGAFFGRKDPE